jgi:hypothetical protein
MFYYSWCTNDEAWGDDTWIDATPSVGEALSIVIVDNDLCL